MQPCVAMLPARTPWAVGSQPSDEVRDSFFGRMAGLGYFSRVAAGESFSLCWKTAAALDSSGQAVAASGENLLRAIAVKKTGGDAGQPADSSLWCRRPMMAFSLSFVLR